jgi:WD40 repeat protein
VSAGLLVACAHDNGAVTLTRWTRGRVQIRRLRGAVKNPRGVALTASGLVLAWDEFGGLRRWRLDGRSAGPDLTGVTGPLTPASMAGREVLVYHAGLALEVREPASGELLARLAGHNEPSRSLASSGAWVASDDAGTLRIWDLDEAREPGIAVEHAVQVAIRHPDGIRTLATEGDTVVAVDDRGEAAPVIEALERATQLAALRTASGDVVAVAMPKGRIGMWRLASASGGQADFLGRTPNRDGQSTALALRDRAGAVALLSAGPAHIRTWRVPRLRETRAALDTGPDFTNYAAFHEHDGRTLAATLSEGGALRVWDVDAARLAHGPFPLGEGSGDAVALGAFSTGGVVACARSPYDGAPAVHVWRLDDGRLLAKFEAPADARITALALGILLGRDVVLAGIDTSTVVWDLDAQVIARIELDAAVKAVVLVPPSEFQAATSKGLISVELRGA